MIYFISLSDIAVLLERFYAPVFELTDFDVEVSFEWIFDVNKGPKVCPTQLSTRRVDNLFFRKNGGKFQAMPQLFLTPTFTINLIKIST